MMLERTGFRYVSGYSLLGGDCVIISYFLSVWMTHSRGSQITNRNADAAEVPFGPPRSMNVTCLLAPPLVTMLSSVTVFSCPQTMLSEGLPPFAFSACAGTSGAHVASCMSRMSRMSHLCVPRRLRSGRACARVAGRSSCAPTVHPRGMRRWLISLKTV